MANKRGGRRGRLLMEGSKVEDKHVQGCLASLLGKPQFGPIPFSDFSNDIQVVHGSMSEAR